MQLTEKPNEQKDLGEPAFSPDGRYVYFTQDATPGRTFEYNKDSQRRDLRDPAARPRDGDDRAVRDRPGGAVRPTPSPDGKTLAFVRRVRVQDRALRAGPGDRARSGRSATASSATCRRRGRSTACTRRSAGRPTAASSCSGRSGKLWRVDDRRAGARARSRSTSRTRARSQEAVRFPVDGRPRHASTCRQLRWVAVSPDGDRVVYSALGHLYLRELPARLAAPADERPTTTSSCSRLLARRRAHRVRDLERRDARAACARSSVAHRPRASLTQRARPLRRAALLARRQDGRVSRSRAAAYLLSPLARPRARRLPRRRPTARRAGTRHRTTGAAPQFGARRERVFVTRRAVKDEVDELDAGEHRASTAATSATSRRPRPPPSSRVSPDGKLGRVRRALPGVRDAAAARPASALDVGPKAEALPVARVERRRRRVPALVAATAAGCTGRSATQLFTRELCGRVRVRRRRAGEAARSRAEHGREHRLRREQPTARRRSSRFVGARIVTMKGDEVIEDGAIVVDGNRIAAVGPRGDVRIPAGAHAHRRRRARRSSRAWSTCTRTAAQATTGSSRSSNWIDLREPRVRRDDDPRPVERHRARSSPRPSCARRADHRAAHLLDRDDPLRREGAVQRARSRRLDDALAHLRRLKAVGAFTVKSYNQPRREQRQQVIEAARELGMMVVPEGGSLFQHNMTMVVDGHTGVEHSLPGRAASTTTSRSSGRGTEVGYTPTLVVGLRRARRRALLVPAHRRVEAPAARRASCRAPCSSRARARREMAPDEDCNILARARRSRRAARTRACTCSSARTASARASARTGSCGCSCRAA